MGDIIKEFADDLHATLLTAFLNAKLLPLWNLDRGVSSISFLLLAQLQLVILVYVFPFST